MTELVSTEREPEASDAVASQVTRLMAKSCGIKSPMSDR
jgi:hypothetical protein